MHERWETLKRDVVLATQWYHVVKEEVMLPSGTVLNDYYVRDNHAAVLVVPRTVDGAFILTKQYKHGAGKEVLEFPAGRIEDGEEATAAAIRELKEETGAEAGHLTMGPVLFDDPTNSRSKIYVFFADGVTVTGKQVFDESESIETVLLSYQGLQLALKTGLLQVAASAAAGYMALERET